MKPAQPLHRHERLYSTPVLKYRIDIVCTSNFDVLHSRLAQPQTEQEVSLARQAKLRKSGGFGPSFRAVKSTSAVRSCSPGLAVMSLVTAPPK